MTGADLRERRRDTTRREISRAAVDLVLERGLGEVTVDDIAESAGVSPRTFFNYFPSKKAALVPGPEPLQQENVERFVADRDTPVLDGLQTLLMSHSALTTDLRDDVRAVQRLLSAYPDLAPVLHESIAGFECSIVDAVARRLDVPSDDDVPRIAAAACSAVLKFAVTSHTDDRGGSLEDDLSAAFAALRALLTT